MRQDLRIVVEGMDGSGKTMLIQQLVKDFPELEIIRNDLGPEQNFNKWWPEQFERLKSARVPIHDRFVFSEIIYGTVIRKKLNVDQNILDNAIWFLRHTCLLIYARPHSEILQNTVMMNPQMDGVHDNFQSLLEMYDQVMMVEQQWMKSRFYRYDWNAQKEPTAVRATVRRYLAGGEPK